MAGRRASAFVFVLIVLAVAALGWFLFQKSVPPGVVPPDGNVLPVGPVPVAGTLREECLAFLRVQAAPARPPAGGGAVPAFSEVRMDALDALVAVDPASAVPLVLAALGGDGDPAAWSPERLHAAGIRIRAGQADGAETVRAYLKSGEGLADDEATAEAARAAVAMAPAEGAGVVRRILAEKAEAFSTEVLAAALQAAAALGDGASPEDLKKHLASEEYLVRGAAAGALLRLGKDPGPLLGEDPAWMDQVELAVGLAVAGNEAVVPLIEPLLKDEQAFTRSGAALALASVGGSRAVAALKGLLKDADPEVRGAAAVALVLLGSKDEIAAARAATGDKDADFAVAAWKALCLAGDAGSKAAAEALFAQPLPPPKDQARGALLQKKVWAAALIVRLTK